MEFEHVNESELIEMENMETTPMTENGKHYIETMRELKNIERKLDEILKQLCKVTSSICNIVTKLNHMDSCILLRE